MDFKATRRLKIWKWFCMAFFCFTFWHCQNVEIAEHQIQPKTFNLSLMVQPVSEQTKAAYIGFEFGWEAGDIAAIIAPNNLYTPLILDSLSVGKKLGSFKGTLNGWEGEKEVYVIYPWSSDGKDHFNLANKSYNFSLSEIQSSADQTLNNKDNARYSLMLGKTTASPSNSIIAELNQMMSFIDFKISKVGNYTVRELQIECNDSVFYKSGTFNLSDFTFTPDKKIKKINVVNNIGYQPGDITLPITLFPVNLSPSGLNKEIFVDVIAVDNASGQLKLFRFNKGVPSKAYERNTRYFASLDLSTVTPLPYQNEFYIDQPIQNASYKDSSYTVNINTNGQKWQATEIPDWITLSQKSGLTSANITVKVKTNNHFLPRTGTITFSSGNEKKTLTFNQALNPEVAGDKAALEAFFAAAGGENWTNKTNWLSEKPLGEWKYITTDGETGRVNALRIIQSENLRGSMSDEVYKLTELKELSLFNMEPKTFSGTLSSKIKNLTKLEKIYLVYVITDIPNEIFDLINLKSIDIFSIRNSETKLIGNERFSNLKNLENLQISEFDLGSQFPTGILTLKNLQRLQLGFTSRMNDPVEIPTQIFNQSSLKEIRFYFGYKLNITSKIGNLQNLECLVSNYPYGELTKDFFNLTKLKEVWLGNTFSVSNLTGNFTSEIGNLKNINTFQIVNCNIMGNLPKEIANIPLQQFRCDGNRLSGKIPFEVLNHPNWERWSPNHWVLPQQDGYKLEVEKYVSTDFSEDGKIVKLHSATKGKGIDIVVLGDGFVDKEIGPGKIYDLTMSRFKDSFLELEPFKTYKDYFNVYMIRAVSIEHGVSDEGNKVPTKFGTLTSQNILPTYNIERVQKYVDSLGFDNSHINLIANSYSIAANCAILPNPNTGEVKTATLMGVNTTTYGINHEAGGHGFGLLADEYMKSCNVQYPIESIELTKQQQDKYGIFTNVDFTSDLSKIRWAHMVNHPKYKGIVGAYEGGLYYYKGVWRAEHESIMGYQIDLNYFNAPSREAIVKQIKKQAGEPYSFEDFVANDKMEIIIDYTKSATIPDKNYKHYPPRVIIDGKEMKY